jgi:sugar lactone lactonase YvrE
MDGYVASEPERNALVEIDLDSRAIVGVYPLAEPGHHGLNDVEIDARGVPFATDTASGQIYTLTDDRRGLAPVFATPPYVGPNGIAADDKGKLLFVADATGIHRLDIATRTTRRLAQPRGSSLGLFDGLYFVRVADSPRLIGIQGQARGRVMSVTLDAALGAVVATEVLDSAHPLFDGPTTGAVVGAFIYVIANSQLWYPREPRETIVVKVPLAI